MYKKEFIATVAKKSKTSKKQIAELVDVMSETIVATLKKGDIVQWKGLGTFKLVERKAREGRNPQTGKKIKIPARKVVSFKLGTTLKAIRK